MKPLFTVHAGEFLVGCEIEHKFRNLHAWVPAKDTGVDFLVTDHNNKKTLPLQVKFSRDYLVIHMKDAVFHNKLRATGGGHLRESRSKILAPNIGYLFS